jgi:1,4-alpha-glucan branching enzyme
MAAVTENRSTLLPEPLRRLAEARHHDPFEVLGRHDDGEHLLVRAFLPHAASVAIAEADAVLERVPNTDFFEWRGDGAQIPLRYRLRWQDAGGATHTQHDPYAFPPQVGDFDLHLYAEGQHWHAYRFLGAHPHSTEGVDGVLFAVWAPNAERVSVVGEFNRWDGRVHPMRSRGGVGVWELFIPGLAPGSLYKFEVRTRSGDVMLKVDPFANRFELRPDTACVVDGPSPHAWTDGDWLEQRRALDWQHAPMSVYEVHLGSWARDGELFMNYRELAHRLAGYVADLGYTHIELLPITEHPLDVSWGYQTTGYFAPTSRFGTPEDLRYFIDHLHQRGIGVILDWVPAHFPRDEHALARFDGTALYEHEDPRRGEHRDWGTLIFNYGRNEVRNFLLASAVYWLEEFHIDGLRVDAVASMLYLDYSRSEGDWVPNEYGGRENLEAVGFLRQLNEVVHQQFPGAMVIAEESTAWPQVSRPTWLGGLGFSMKWNMGWMHDTLSYLAKDPVYRHYHHDLLTFGLLYAFSENFVLPFSHDEVVHGKGAMLTKMPGDHWQKFASLRLLYLYQYTQPGKKLLFMSGEFGQWDEWDCNREIQWQLLEYPTHQGVQSLVRDLNRLYRGEPALHALDFEPAGFEWIDCHDSSQSVLSFVRKDGRGRQVAVVLNFTPVPRYGYRIGVPVAGVWREVINSDSAFYGGSNVGNLGELRTDPTPWMGRDQSFVITLPPLGGVVLRWESAG